MVANIQHFGKKDDKTETVTLSTGQEVEIKQIKNAQLMMRAERALMIIDALGEAVLIAPVLEEVDPQRVEAFVVPLEQAARALESIARKPI